MSPSPSLPGPGGLLRVLRNPSYRYLWFGSVISSLGASIGGVVLLWVVFTSTHSALDVALLGVVGFLPTVAFGILAGAVIDRTDRRRLMIGCDLGRVVALGLLAAYTLLFGVSLALVLLAALVVATFSTVFRPATNAVIPSLLGLSEVTDGNGLLMAGTTVAGFAGSPVGGILIVVVGVVGGLTVNAATFGFSAAMVSLMLIPAVARTPVPAGTPRRSLLADVAEGLRYLRSQRALLSTTLSAMAANFFLGMYFQFIVVYAGEQLHVGATGFGVLLAVGAAGWGLGGLLAGRLPVQRAPGLWYASGWTLASASIVGSGVVTTLPLAAALGLGFGLLGGLSNTTFLSTVQRTVPPEMLGRYFATDEAGSFAMIPAGTIAGGFLILAVGVGSTFVFAGLAGIATNGVLLAFPSVRAWGRPGRTGSPPASTGPSSGP